MESKDVPGLYFAGQVNGTSGYEEAGAQGIVAGMNAALAVMGRDPLIFSRVDGYIGVMIDDLTTKGTDEPYRMFTSRAEYRLLLREDNADLRLSEFGRQAGLLSDESYEIFTKRRSEVAKWRSEVTNHHFFPTAPTNEWLSSRGLSPLKDRVSGEAMLRRPEIGWAELCDLGFAGEEVSEDVREQVEIQVKYQGYIQRDLESLEGVQKSEQLLIPRELNFEEIPSLSAEIRGRLRETRPETVGQASRMIGMTPAAVASLVIYLKTKKQQKTDNPCTRLSLSE